MGRIVTCYFFHFSPFPTTRLSHIRPFSRPKLVTCLLVPVNSFLWLRQLEPVLCLGFEVLTPAARWFLARLIFGSEDGSDTLPRNSGLHTTARHYIPEDGNILLNLIPSLSGHEAIYSHPRVFMA
jgi:hypothetical protein